MDLLHLGWNDFFAQQFEEYARHELVPARIAAQHRELYRAYGEQGELVASVSGSLRSQAAGPQDFPVVGDWVAVRPRPRERSATIHAVLRRRTQFSRKVAGRATAEQVAAANVDTVFLVMGLDGDFNLRRLERYLVTAYESGAAPVVVLNKRDLCDAGELAGKLVAVESVAPGVPAYAASALTGDGLEDLGSFLSVGRTAALLGSSGVGKSALINRWLGREALRTAPVREHDSRGRHTTTQRKLVLLPGTGMIMDTPGMRELQFWSAGEGMNTTFADLSELAAGCRFHDCSHRAEPGCAVLQAVNQGRLDAGRLESFHKTRAELAALERRQDALKARAYKRHAGSLERLLRSRLREKR
ncbi:MAG: ribosome small subunit-dependent GTPase A [Acidobacteria bacterium]|nr:ribosome small subunit-dependent GTPase A [Acidobacteriota bacterium]